MFGQAADEGVGGRSCWSSRPGVGRIKCRDKGAHPPASDGASTSLPDSCLAFSPPLSHSSPSLKSYCGQPPTSCSPRPLAVVSDAAAGGQVLLCGVTFQAIKELGRELGKVKGEGGQAGGRRAGWLWRRCEGEAAQGHSREGHRPVALAVVRGAAGR